MPHTHQRTCSATWSTKPKTGAANDDANNDSCKNVFIYNYKYIRLQILICKNIIPTVYKYISHCGVHTAKIILSMVGSVDLATIYYVVIQFKKYYKQHKGSPRKQSENLHTK